MKDKYCMTHAPPFVCRDLYDIVEKSECMMCILEVERKKIASNFETPSNYEVYREADR